MKKNYLWGIGAMMAIAGSAFAGSVIPARVTVDLDARIAFGDQLTARTSANDVELIGCGVRYFDDGMGGAFSFGFCQAINADEETILCQTMSPSLLDAIKSLNSYSYITFTWNELGDCTQVGNSTQSFYLFDPDVKPKKKN